MVGGLPHETVVELVLLWLHVQFPIKHLQEVGLRHVDLVKGEATALCIVVVAVAFIIVVLCGHQHSEEHQAVATEAAECHGRLQLRDAVDVDQGEHKTLITAIEALVDAEVEVLLDTDRRRFGREEAASPLQFAQDWGLGTQIVRNPPCYYLLEAIYD